MFYKITLGNEGINILYIIKKKRGGTYLGLVLVNEIFSYEDVENPGIIISGICRHLTGKTTSNFRFNIVINQATEVQKQEQVSLKSVLKLKKN